jgi:cytoskeletal protein CcmA (bactofilin family)
MPSQIKLKRTFGIGLPDLPPVGTGVTDGELVYVYDTNNLGVGGTYRKLYIGSAAGVNTLPYPVGGQYYMERLPDDLTQEGVLLPRKVLSANSNSLIDRIQVGSGLSVSGISTFKNDVYIEGDLDVTGDITFDEFTARQVVVTGVATVNQALSVGVTFNVPNAYIAAGLVTSLVGTYATVTTVDIETLDAKDVNITGLAVTDIVGTAATITTIDATEGDIVNAKITAGIITDIVGTAATITTVDVTNLAVTNLTLGSGIFTDIQVSGASTFAGIATFQSDVYVDGNLNVRGDIVYDEVNGRNLNISGVGTIANLNVTGVSTFDGLIDANGDLDVDGHTELDNVRISGVTTFGPGTSGNEGDIDFQHNGATRAYWDGSAGSFELKDGSSIAFGDSDDVLAFWDGTDFYLSKQTVSGSIKFTKSTGSENIAVFSNDGPVELYYDNSKKFETTGYGVTIYNELRTPNLNVTGVSTVVGVATFQNDVYVAGNLNVIGDVVYDEVTGRNINISGVGTIANLITTGISTIPTLDVENLDALDAKITTGLVTSLTGTYATITDTLTVGTAITFRSGIVSATTLTGEIVRVDTAIYDSNNNVGAANSILTISGGKLIWQNPQEANISTSFAPGNTYYVSENGSNDNEGDRPERPWRNVGYALTQISNIGENDVLNISAGVYEETFPLTVPRGLTVKGAGLRATKVMPTTATKQEDCFLMNDRTVVEDLTVGGLYFDTPNNKGYAFKYAPGIAITTRSPYVQRVTVLNFGSNITADDPYGYNTADSPPSFYIAGGGAYVDGSECTSDSLEAGFLFNECTFIVPNSKALSFTNGARVEFLNCFSYFAATGIEGLSGSVGFASTGKTRLRATGLTTDVGVGNTVTYFDTDGVTGLATGIVASADATYFRIQGKSTGFEVLSNRSAQAVTFNGDAQLSTNFPKFGTAALYLDGTNDSISAETSGGFGFGTGDFTVEFFIRPDEITGKKTLFDLRDGSDSDTAINVVSLGASIGLQVGTTTAILGNTGLSTGTYYHVAVARTDSNTKLFIDGTQEGSTYSDSNDYGSTKPMVLGAEYDGATGAYKGYIDEYRVEKGVGKYRANFTAPVAELLGDRDTSVLLHFNGSAGVTTTADDIIVNQDIRIEQAGGGIGTATKLTLADFSQFGADMRSVGCAVEYGQKGVVADGDGVALRLFAVNFNFVGAGGDFSNDPNLAVQANEVTELNNGEVSYVSIDHKGDFRVGEAFFVDQENGTVSFTNQVTSLQALSSLTITDGTNSSVITPTSGQFGNVSISGNSIETLSGDLNLNPAGSGEVNIVGNVNIAGILTASVVQIDAFQKGDTSIALDDTGSDGTIRFNTDGVEGMRLTNTQRLGVGTDAPDQRLHVEGNVYVSGIGTFERIETSNADAYSFYGGKESGLTADTSSERNIVLGYQAGYDLSGSDDNIIIGYQAVSSTSNSFSTRNVAIGNFSLVDLSTGDYNIAMGYSAGKTITSGVSNIAIGDRAMDGSGTSGNYNVALGAEAGLDASGIDQNVLIGYKAAGTGLSGDGNVYLGYYAGRQATSTFYNTIIGAYAGEAQTLEGDYNTFLGYQAGRYTNTGSNNLALGAFSLGGNFVSGQENVAIGLYASYAMTNGFSNISIGREALRNITTGDYNIALGYQVGYNLDGNQTTTS